MSAPSCDCIPKHFKDSKNLLHRFKLEALEAMLEADGVSFSHLCFILQATGSVISGSTILQCLNNDKEDGCYLQRDVDIYVEKKNAALLNALLYPIFDYSKIPLNHSNGKVYYNTVKSPNGGMFNNMTDMDYPEALPSIIGLYNYSCRRKGEVINYKGEKCEVMKFVRPYQIIVLDDGVKPTDFVANFDLTICQNYFDGLNFVSYHPKCVSTKKGYITRLVDEKRMVRIKKYEERGYTILNK